MRGLLRADLFASITLSSGDATTMVQRSSPTRQHLGESYHAVVCRKPVLKTMNHLVLAALRTPLQNRLAPRCCH